MCHATHAIHESYKLGLDHNDAYFPADAGVKVGFCEGSSGLHKVQPLIVIALCNGSGCIKPRPPLRNSNPNDRCSEGGATALTTAIRDNNLEFVDLLLKHGANPAVRGQDWPLCMAVKSPIVLKRLLDSPGLNPRAFRGCVEMAVHAGQLESVKLLLGAGVSVEDKNCGVFSPLTTAIREGHKSIVRFLLDEANADPNAPGEHLPLVKALRSYDGHDMEVIQMLLSRGADINRMHRGWNAVLQAVENSDAEILGLLVSLGGPVDLQAVDETGRPVIDIVGDRDWEEGLALLFPKSSSPKGKT